MLLQAEEEAESEAAAAAMDPQQAPTTATVAVYVLCRFCFFRVQNVPSY